MRAVFVPHCWVVWRLSAAGEAITMLHRAGAAGGVYNVGQEVLAYFLLTDGRIGIKNSMNQYSLILSLLLGLSMLPPVTTDAATLQVSTFSVDITPPLGRPVGLGFIPPLTTIEHPLLARGLLLDDGRQRVVLCTLDWMEVHNESYDFLREVIAEAASVSPQSVFVHAVHQHSAPAISTAAQRLQLDKNDPRRVATAEYLSETGRRIAGALRECRGDQQQITHLASGKATVERVASSRRLEKADGSIQGRSSSTKGSPELRELPEGTIDPVVRTVGLFQRQQAVVYLHYYATHPMSFYGDGRASYDIPGIIRKDLEEKTGAFHLYFTGCGGDVAMGKYNDGSVEARQQLTGRLQQGIEKSMASLQRVRLGTEQFQWSVVPLRLSRREDAAFGREANEQILADDEAKESIRRKAAIALAWLDRNEAGKPVEISCLSIGHVQLLHLPGEPFVQYQLAAQQMHPDRFICVAGYGDCGMGYIGGDRIFTDRGGYEQTYSFSGPSEQRMLEKIRQALHKE